MKASQSSARFSKEDAIVWAMFCLPRMPFPARRAATLRRSRLSLMPMGCNCRCQVRRWLSSVSLPQRSEAIFRSMGLACILWLSAGVPLVLGEEKSLETLHREILRRRVSIAFADQSTATAIVEEIRPTSLFLRITKSSNTQLHPIGQGQITLSSISRFTYWERENPVARILRTAIASALSVGILARCTWRSQPYVVAVDGVASSQTPLVVTPLEVPGCEP